MFLCFCFVWAHGFCLSFLCAMCSHANCLDPTILYPDYWLICPTCLPSLPSSFAPFIISLCLQSCASSSSNVSRSCRALPCLALPCLALPCLALPCPALPCPALPCPALPCQALPAVLFFPYGVVFVAVFFLKPILLHNWVFASSLHPQPWQKTFYRTSTFVFHRRKKPIRVKMTNPYSV